PVAVVGLGLGAAVPSGQPASVSVSAAQSAANASWAPPTYNGGATVYGYVVTVIDAGGGTATGVQGATTRTTSTRASITASATGYRAASSGTSMLFSGLSNARSYRIDVAPLTRAGMGRARLSSVVRPGSHPTPMVGYRMVDRSGHVYAFGGAS